MSIIDLIGDGKVVVRRDVSTEPDGEYKIEFGTEVEIEYDVFSAAADAWADGDPFPETVEKLGHATVRFAAGRGQAIKGLDVAVCALNPGDSASVFIRQDCAFGAAGNEASGAHLQSEVVPPSTSLVYRLRVLSAAKQKDAWEMSNVEKMAAAERKRAEGNAAFGREEYADAERLYNVAVQTLEKVTPEDETGEQALNAAKSVVYVNLGMALFKQQRYRECVAQCNLALGALPSNTKALYRRAAAFEAVGDLDEAVADLKAARAASGDAVDPNVVKSLRRVQGRLETQTAAARKLFSAAFDSGKLGIHAEMVAARAAQEEAEGPLPPSLSAVHTAQDEELGVLVKIGVAVGSALSAVAAPFKACARICCCKRAAVKQVKTE